MAGDVRHGGGPGVGGAEVVPYVLSRLRDRFSIVRLPPQRPRSAGKHVIMETNEYLELGEDYDVHDAIQIHRRFGARWLATSRYTPFTTGFVDTCRKHELVSTDHEWWQYLLSGAFFDDFYMADVIKYRGANPSTGAVKTAFSSHLIHELEHVDPDLVFAFGKQAWETLQSQLGAEPVGDPPAGPGVNEIHGALHTATRLMDTDILPLGHPSTNFRGAQISHEEYMQRLEAGVEDWAETT